MRYFTHDLVVPNTATTELTADGELVWEHAGRFVEKTVQVTLTGTLTATISLDGTIDGENWVSLAEITENAIIAVGVSVAQLRVSVTGWGEESGTVSAIFAGFEPRVGAG